MSAAELQWFWDDRSFGRWHAVPAGSNVALCVRRVPGAPRAAVVATGPLCPACEAELAAERRRAETIARASARGQAALAEWERRRLAANFVPCDDFIATDGTCIWGCRSKADCCDAAMPEPQVPVGECAGTPAPLETNADSEAASERSPSD